MKKLSFILILLILPTILAVSNNSIIPEKYSNEISYTLQFYPELENTTIIFKEKEIKHTMESRPRLNFIFLPEQKHIYQIIMNNGTTEKNGILIENLNSTQKIGVIAHELAHIIDYKTKTDFGIIFLGIGYLFTDSRTKTEHRIDEITINHSLGEELISFEIYASNPNNTNENYRKTKDKYYYSVENLIKLQNEFENK